MTILDFHPHCSDVTVCFDYSSLNLTQPIFFIGGLAQMGGLELASGVFEKINSIPLILRKILVGFLLVLTLKNIRPDPKNMAGWGTLIEKNNLKFVQTISLPTVWTFHELDETPYIFAQLI